jgi:hypothetical protein
MRCQKVGSVRAGADWRMMRCNRARLPNTPMSNLAHIGSKPDTAKVADRREWAGVSATCQRRVHKTRFTSFCDLKVSSVTFLQYRSGGREAHT